MTTEPAQSVRLDGIAREALLALGLAMPLAILAISSSDVLSAYTGFQHMQTPVAYAAMLALIVAALASMRLAGAANLVRRLVPVVLATVTAWCALVVFIAFGGLGDAALAVAATVAEVLRRAFTIGLILLWNVPLSRTRDVEVPRIAAFAAGLSMALFLVASVAGTVAVVLVAVLAYAGVALFVVMGSYGSPGMETTGDADGADVRGSAGEPPVQGDGDGVGVDATRRRFFGSRIAWHLALTAVLILSYGSAEATPSDVGAALLVAVGLAVLAAAALILAPGTRSTAFLTTAFPCAMGALVVATFMGADRTALTRVFPVVATAVWYMQLQIQLPSYRVLTRMEATDFALKEKLIPLVAVYVLYAAMAVLPWDVTSLVGGSNVPFLVSMMLLLLLTASSMATMLRHVARYYPVDDGIAVAGKEASGDGGSEAGPVVCAAMAARYGLTPRETDVLAYLIQGYSKAYVTRALCISMATVKSHTVAIYRKTGVDSHDALIDLAHTFE